MTRAVDHAQEARRILREVKQYPDDPAEHAISVSIAQVHATLALEAATRNTRDMELERYENERMRERSAALRNLSRSVSAHTAGEYVLGYVKFDELIKDVGRIGGPQGPTWDQP